MKQQKPDICETWNLAFSACTKRSHLYALEPRNMGTPMIESFTSYLCRLAEAHSVSLHTLVVREVLPLLKREYLSNPLNNYLDPFWGEASRALNGTGVLAEDWGAALEQLTLRSDLRFLTLLPWNTVLTQQRLLRPTRAWCPDCFMEWQASGQPVYEPLLWNFSAVSLCLQHQRTLLEKCPYQGCGAKLPVLASRFHVGYCSKCLRWLGIPSDLPEPPKRDAVWDWQAWVTEKVGELLQHNMDLVASPHLKNLPHLLSSAREQATDRNWQVLGRRLQLSRRTLNAWQIGRQIPQVESLMRLCYCCGISPYDLFTSQAETLTLNQLMNRDLPDLPNLAGKRRHPVPFNANLIRQSLESVWACEEVPPTSMRTIAKCLNYSPRELRHHFPELCHAISLRYKNYIQDRAKRKLEKWKDEVRCAILAIHSQGLRPTSERIRPLLSQPHIIRDRVISKYWHEVLDDLGLNN